MTDPHLLREVGHALYGPSTRTWQDAMSDALDINLRTIQRWAIGEGEPPPAVWGELVSLLMDKSVADANLAMRLAPLAKDAAE